MTFLKMRHIGQEARYSILSLLSLTGVLVLHLFHWVSAPLIMGATAEMHAGHHGMGSSGSIFMSLMMLLLFTINIVSMFFAVRQLLVAIRKDGKHTKHTLLCSSISCVVLCMGIYTIMTL